MSLPDFKSFTLKDWLYFIGVVATLSMSWAILNQKVEQIARDHDQFTIRQIERDAQQDLVSKETTRELKDTMREQTQEIKAEIRELRRDVVSHPKK
jgi:hypothetical protein